MSGLARLLRLGLVTGLLLTAVTTLTGPARAAVDLQVPTLSSIALVGSERVFSPGDTVTIAYEASDDDSGLAALGVYVTGSIGDEFYLADSAPFDGTLTWTVPESAVNGPYVVALVHLADAARNAVQYYPDGLVQHQPGGAEAPDTHDLDLTALEFAVTGSARDVAVPTLTSLSLAEDDQVLQPGDSLSFSYTASDDSGLDSVEIRLTGPIGDGRTLADLPPLDGTVTWTLPDTVANGPYRVAAVHLTDTVGNTARYRVDGSVLRQPAGATGPDSHSLDLDLGITVTGSTRDTEVPTLSALTLAGPGRSYRPGDTITFDYGATDNAELLYAMLNFRGPVGDHVTFIEEAPFDGVLTWDLPASVFDGTYQVHWVFLRDVAGNGAYYRPDGTVEKSPSGASGPDTHDVDLAGVAFTVGYERPTPPRSVVASPGDRSVQVEWRTPVRDGGSPVTGYTVTASPGGASTTVPADRTSATLTGLDNGTPYTLEVTATNAIGTSRPGAAAAPATPLAVPGAPTDVTAAPGDGRAAVTWVRPATTGGSAITGYAVTAEPGGATRTVGPAARATSLTGLSNGRTYAVRVVALNANGASPPSAPAVPVTPIGPPDAPGGVEATPGDGRASVTWSRPASTGGLPVTGYTVTSRPGGFTVTVGPGARRAYVNGLTNGTAYTFKVTASNDVGTSPASLPSARVTPAGRPGVVSTLTAVAGDRRAVLEWSPADPNGAALVRYTILASPGGLTRTVGPAAHGTTFPGLTNGVAYRFRVFATNSVGDGPLSPASDRVVPVAPG